MKITAKVALEVATHEAIIRQAYKDSRNVWTWSVGLTKASGYDPTRYIGKPQPMDDCLAAYIEALRRYAADVRRAFKGHNLSESEFAAALSFHWNTGAIGRASWVKSFKAGRRADAQKQIMQWTANPELRKRREAERDLFFDGRWSQDGKITEYTRVTKRHTPVWKSGKRVDVTREIERLLGHVPADVPEPAEPADDTREWQKDRDLVHRVQQRLWELGYFEVGRRDGLWGSRTRGALLAFKADQGLPLDESMDDATLRQLMTAERRGVDPDRAEASPGEVAESSRTARAARNNKFAAWLIGIPGAIIGFFKGLLDSIPGAQDLLDPARAILGSLSPGMWGVLIVLVAAAIWWQANKAEAHVLEDFREGKRP